MLVLGRKKDDAIVIGDHIRITVVAVCGNTVRLGVEAPHPISVVRGEIATRNETEGRREFRNE